MLYNEDFKTLFGTSFFHFCLEKTDVYQINDETFRISYTEKDSFILKKRIKTNKITSLRSDFLNYRWLKSKVPVPKVVFLKEIQNIEYLCLTELHGKTLDYWIGKIEPKRMVSIYAKSLKYLHSIPINKKALFQDLTDKLKVAKLNIESGIVDCNDLQPEYKSYSLDQLYITLYDLKPSHFDFVFTHGDYCFDNLIFQNSELCGFIDIGRGGIADRYQDIALAIRNIKDVYDNSLVDLFFEEYGLLYPDVKKIEFYTLLDEFY
ncbi:APH(3') family aminoglycoside O-phosphotransferase [Flavobacterium sp.]|uniref:APH(3') family aminoglycoside O-phosphotransferase n=1 Tax=Flavobacterium sp. TaxID=239 RepID=UPI002FDB49A7